MAESLRFDIFAIDRASKTFDKIGEHSEKMGGKLGKAGELAGRAFKAVTAGAAAATVAFGFGLKAAADYQKITAQTGAVLKSTGDVSHQTAEGIQRLSESISANSTFSRDAVQQGANLLLTFTNLRDSAGKGGKVFDRANKVLADMATALGTTPRSAATKLGKALNDPVKGLTSLGRVGVTFTDSQKKVIKHLVATGQTAKAQGLILDELQKKFGGSAAAAGNTFAGSMEKLKNSLMDVVVNALTPLLPKLTEAAGWLAKKLPAGIKIVSGWFDTLKGKFTQTGGAGDQLKTAIHGIWQWLQANLIPQLESAAKKILPALKNALKDLGQALVTAKPYFQALATILVDVLLPVMADIATVALRVIGPAFKAVAWGLNNTVLPIIKLVIQRTLDALAFVIDGAAKAFGWVPGIGGKLKNAAKAFDTFRRNVNASLNGIKPDVTIAFHATMDANLRKIIATVGGQKGAGLQKGVHGSTVNASGTPSFPGGFGVVGDAGAELIEMPPGTRVHTASATSRMGGGVVQHNTIYLTAPGDDINQAKRLVALLQKLQNSTGPLQLKVAR